MQPNQGRAICSTATIEAIASIKATQEDIILPTINTKEVDPERDGKFDLTLGKAGSRTVNYTISNTFGFGGHIATVIFKKY